MMVEILCLKVAIVKILLTKIAMVNILLTKVAMVNILPFRSCNGGCTSSQKFQ
jgi:hypothetical protein